MTNKYSLWIVPQADEGEKLQKFVNTLAEQNNAPVFVPHLTLVANIPINSVDKYKDLDARITQLAQQAHPLNVTLSHFGSTDEEFRCLFLYAKPTEELDTAYSMAADYFPQVNDEHFRAMPHMSLLYGNYNSGLKQGIMDSYMESEVTNMTFRVESFDLYLTNEPTDSWKLEKCYPLNS